MIRCKGSFFFLLAKGIEQVPSMYGVDARYNYSISTFQEYHILSRVILPLFACLSGRIFSPLASIPTKACAYVPVSEKKNDRLPKVGTL